MNKRKILASLLSIVLIGSSLPAAAAAQEAPSQACITASVYTADAHVLQIDPRFTHISRISSSLTIKSGIAECTGSYTVYNDYDNDSTMTVTLQQFKNNRWVDVDSWSEDYTGSGIKFLSEKIDVDSGYRYRVVTAMQILDDNGKAIETVSCDSPIKES